MKSFAAEFDTKKKVIKSFVLKKYINTLFSPLEFNFCYKRNKIWNSYY